MKVAITTLFLLLVCVTKQSSAQLVASVRQQMLVYSGVDNYIDFALKNLPSKEIELKASQGELYHESGKVIWKTCNPTSSILTLYALNTKTEKVVDSHSMKIHELPPPSVELKFGHADDQSKLYNSSGIIAVAKDFAYDARYKVLTANLTISGQKGRITKSLDQGNFAPEIREYLKTGRDGDTITIDNVVVQFGCTSSSKKLSDGLQFIQRNGKQYPIGFTGKY